MIPRLKVYRSRPSLNEAAVIVAFNRNGLPAERSLESSAFCQADPAMSWSRRMNWQFAVPGFRKVLQPAATADYFRELRGFYA